MQCHKIQHDILHGGGMYACRIPKRANFTNCHSFSHKLHSRAVSCPHPYKHQEPTTCMVHPGMLVDDRGQNNPSSWALVMPLGIFFSGDSKSDSGQLFYFLYKSMVVTRWSFARVSHSSQTLFSHLDAILWQHFYLALGIPEFPYDPITLK